MEIRLRAVGFSYASRERNCSEQPFDFPLSMCNVCDTPRDAFDVTSFYFMGKLCNLYVAGSPQQAY